MSYHGHGGPPAGGFGYPPAGGPPAGGYGPPAGGPPAGGYGPPAGGYGPPAGGFGYPAAGGPPAGGYGPPAGGPPAGGYGPPAGGYGPPAGGYGPPAGGFGYPAAGGPPAGMAPNIGRYGQQGDAATQGYQNDGSGALWCAVANTQWGTIPGKAKDGTCWYSYAGKEHVTSDFSWLNSTTPLQKVKNQGSMPEGVVPGGFQSDGSGHYYPAIAETRHGQIPGKAKGNSCWYPYGGKEQTTSNFSWIVQRPSMRLERRAGAPPNGVKLAFQTDGGGEQWSAVADTPHGNIPGKAKGSTCWYAYGGKEHTTSSFSWLVCDSPVYTVPNEGRPPRGAFKCGHQTDGGGDFYAAIANTDWGTIPGKAKDNTCWYAYGGKEHYTSKFLWITSVQ